MTRTSRAQPYWPAKAIDVAGKEITVRRASPSSTEVDPALFVHGLGGSSLDWTLLMGLLVEALDAEALDLPGFGMSPPADRVSVRGYADLVGRMVELRGRGPVHLIGNSLGGAVATRVAAVRPELVQTLTLISPALPDLRLTRTTTAIGVTGLPFIGGRILRRLAALPPEKRLNMIIAMCIADPKLLTEEWRGHAVEEIRRRSGLPHSSRALALGTRGLIQEYLDPRPGRLWRLARQVAAPTLLIYGRRDRLVRPRTGERAQRTFPNARLVMLDHTGHLPHIERPETVAAEIRDLINRPETTEPQTL